MRGFKISGNDVSCLIGGIWGDSGKGMAVVGGCGNIDGMI